MTADESSGKLAYCSDMHHRSGKGTNDLQLCFQSGAVMPQPPLLTLCQILLWNSVTWDH